MARLRIVYLIAVSLGVFLVRDPRFAPLVLVLHLLAAPLLEVRVRHSFRMFWRLRFFFLFLIVIQTLFPPRSHFFVTWCVEHLERATDGLAVPIVTATGRPLWSIGFAAALFQMTQIFTMVLASAVVRAGDAKREFLDGLRGFFVPKSAVEVIDASFTRLESDRPRRRRDDPGDGTTDTRRRPSIAALWRGDVGWIVDRLEGEIAGDAIIDPSDNTDRDARLMIRVTTVLMTLRMLRLAPGTGLSPGYQNVVVIPLLCLAADRTRRRFGASVVGTSTGVLSVLLGLGRNGLFILPAHILPAVLIDLAWPLVGRKGPTFIGCALLGACAGFARFTGMLLVLLLLDNPELLAAVPFFSAGHIFFGLLSGAVTRALIRESRARDPQGVA